MKQQLTSVHVLSGITGQFYGALMLGSGQSSEENKTSIVPIGGTFRNLKVQLQTAPGGSTSRTFTLRVNGSNTALTVTISGANTTGLDNTHEVSVNAGDRVVWHENTAGGTPAASTAGRFTAEFEPSTDDRYVILGAGTENANTAANRFATPLGNNNGLRSTLDYRAQTVVPHSTVLTEVYFRVSAAPGSGKSYRLSVTKNGVEDTSTRVTISDLATTGNVTGLSVAFSQGDDIGIQITPSGTPTAAIPQWGLLFNPDTNGESMMFFVNDSNTEGSSSTMYHQLLGVNTADDSNEARNTGIGGPTSFTLKNLTVELENAPGIGKSRQINLRKNGGNGNQSVTISDSSTSGNDNSNTDSIAEGDLVASSQTPSGTPTSSSMRVSFVSFISPGSASDIKSFLGALQASVKKFLNIDNASTKSVMGVSNV